MPPRLLLLHILPRWQSGGEGPERHRQTAPPHQGLPHSLREEPGAWLSPVDADNKGLATKAVEGAFGSPCLTI